MPNDESMPSLVRPSSALATSGGIKLPDPPRVRSASVSAPGGVPPMFQMWAPSTPDGREAERISD
jgi:hypothetical protein